MYVGSLSGSLTHASSVWPMIARSQLTVASLVSGTCSHGNATLRRAGFGREVSLQQTPLASLASLAALWLQSFFPSGFLSGHKQRSQLPDAARGPLACERGPCRLSRPLVFAACCTVVFALRHFGEDVGSNEILLERPAPAVSRRRGGALRGNRIRCVV